ncbi:MAG: UvrD-helicase domain-containing protein [Candidatus Competibacteraceae bacterium]|nr:UvrD-helicase domain-containing protein [Candidatus Competibacteraceae bacterium]
MASDNLAILAAAGSRKTEQIVELALAVKSGNVLITTYTEENQRQIVSRIEQKVGTVPSHISIMGWFSFLIAQCAKPYQRALTQEPLLINGLNFKGTRKRYTKKKHLSYFIDRNRDMYRDGVSDFVVKLNAAVNSAIVKRLERIFTHVFIDEVQDLVGYDLEVLDLLLVSQIKMVLVGDPRQHTFATNTGAKHPKYRGIGLTDWFAERSAICGLEERTESYRCCQAICDFADAIYPNLPATTSVNVPPTHHDGIMQVCFDDIEEYVAEYGPVTILRYDKRADTKGFQAINIGVAKGSTFDRVLIFPTKPMLQYLIDRNPVKLKTREKLYVAVTRARFSVAFVVPRPQQINTPLYLPNRLKRDHNP